MNIFRRNGFTIIELLTTIAVFSILIAIGVGGFVRALHTQRQVASLIAAQSNAAIALEQMAREIRTGYLFCNDPANNGNPNAACFSHCAVNGTVWTCDGFLDFYNANIQVIDYSLNGGALERDVNGQGPTPITGDTVKVINLTFRLFGNTEGDQWPPRITIDMGVVPNSSDPALTSNVLNLQTTISARGIDCASSGPTPC